MLPPYVHFSYPNLLSTFANPPNRRKTLSTFANHPCEILRDFGYTQTAPTHIYEDNLACVAMSENPVRRKFSRHIDIRRYFVCDMVAASVIKLVPLRTHLMVLDALTKSLPSPAHIKHRDIMLGHVPFSFAARTLWNFIGGGG